MFADLSTKISDIVQQPGQAYSSILSIVLLGTVGLIVLHLVLALIGGRAKRPRKRFNLWEKLVYLGTFVSVAVLGATAFYTVLKSGGMHGWWLFAHMFGAGAMVVTLPLLAITWCGASRLGRGRQGEEEETYGPRFFWIPKIMFWLFLISGLTVMVTMLLSMLPLFGTDGLNVLLVLHRYAGLLAVVVFSIHVYCMLLQRAHLR